MANPETPVMFRGIPDRYLPDITGAISRFQSLAANGEITLQSLQSGWEMFAEFDAAVSNAKGLGKTANGNIREALKRFTTHNTHRPSITIACEQLRLATAESNQEEPGVLLHELKDQELANAVRFCEAMTTAVTL